MNELITRQQGTGLVISTETKKLIQSSIYRWHPQTIPATIEADRSLA